MKGINRREFISYFFAELVLPIGDLGLKGILLTQNFTHNINIAALDMKYFRQSMEPGRTNFMVAVWLS